MVHLKMVKWEILWYELFYHNKNGRKGEKKGKKCCLIIGLTFSFGVCDFCLLLCTRRYAKQLI